MIWASCFGVRVTTVELGRELVSRGEKVSWGGSTVEDGREVLNTALGLLWCGLGWASALSPAVAALRCHRPWGVLGSFLGFLISRGLQQAGPMFFLFPG